MNDLTAGSQSHTLAASKPLSWMIFEQAVGFHRAGEDDKAEILYRAVLVLDPSHAEAHYNLGLIFYTQRRLPEAIAAYRDAIFSRSDYADAYSNLGTILKEQGRLDDAIRLYRQAVALAPESAVGYGNLGVAFNDQGKHEQAIAACRQAIAIAPDYEWPYVNMAPALLESGQAAESHKICRRAIALKPGMAMAHYNFAASAKSLNRIDECIAAFRQAIDLQPDFAEAHFGLGQVLLMKGDFEAGWPEYDWRWRLAEYTWLRNIHGEFPQPRWRGEDLTGKTILIYAEQGLGDAIQYVRYIPRVVLKGGKVILAVHPPLKPLFNTIPGVTVVTLDQVPLPHFDFHCPLLSLPWVFGTRLGSVPAEIPYLSADPAKTASWRERMAGDGLRVGIVWAGNPTQRGDRWRSPRLGAVMPLFDVPGVDFFALQMGPGRQDLATCPLPAHVRDLGEEIGDFADTAAIMAGLDLMITSCTAPLHLACAMGVPTWAIIPYAPHFLWQLERSDSPWYPTLRLYRQTALGTDWTAPVRRVAADLAEMAGRR